MSCETHPCVHYADTPHSLCIIGRTAPADCSRGCAGYLADIRAAMGLGDAEHTRRKRWSSVMSDGAEVEETRHA